MSRYTKTYIFTSQNSYEVKIVTKLKLYILFSKFAESFPPNFAPCLSHIFKRKILSTFFFISRYDNILLTSILCICSFCVKLSESLLYPFYSPQTPLPHSAVLYTLSRGITSFTDGHSELSITHYELNAFIYFPLSS